MTDRDNLIEEMADNILATIYLMESLDLTEEVSEILKEKHNRNRINAENGCFVKREKCRNLGAIQTTLLNQIKNNKGSEPIIATPLDEHYAMVIELHISYAFIYIQKYNENSTKSFVEKLYGTSIFSESMFWDKDYELDLKQKIKKVYECYKRAIII